MRVNPIVAITLLILASAAMAQPPAKPPLGTVPDASVLPKAEFVWEERVGLSPAVVLGKTALGSRQYIPITGGTIAGPKFNGKVVPGGWDFQLQMASGCGTLSADYFIQADDGTLIHVLNEAMNCGPAGPDGARNFTRARLEAPEGPYGWMTRAVFVTTIEADGGAPAANGKPAPLGSIRIKFYQIK